MRRLRRGELGLLGAWLLVVSGLGALMACDPVLIPKPMGYPRIDFPEKVYSWYDSATPFGFEKPQYAQVQHVDEAGGYDLLFPGFRAAVHLTYYDRPGALDTLAEDARRMAYKHTVRADAIEERFLSDSARHVHAMLYLIRGEVASSVQFYAVDSMRRYLRGALYFYAQPNVDSLAPAIDFFTDDIIHLIETLRWE